MNVRPIRKKVCQYRNRIRLRVNGVIISSLARANSDVVSTKRERVKQNSTADTCKNCAKCGIGFKIGKNEACNVKIKIRVGDCRNFLLLFVQQYGCLRQKHFTEEENS